MINDTFERYVKLTRRISKLADKFKSYDSATSFEETLVELSNLCKQRDELYAGLCVQVQAIADAARELGASKIRVSTVVRGKFRIDIRYGDQDFYFIL